MKKTLTRLVSFCSFDLPTNYNYLHFSFQQIQRQSNRFFLGGTIKFTYHKLISEYWWNALKHYIALLVTSIIIVIPLAIPFEQFNKISFAILVLTCFAGYVPLYFMIYRPIFNLEFRPRLAVVMAEFEGKERLYLEKCKQAQMSNTALAIAFYVLSKTSEIQLNKMDIQLGNHLMTLFGSSPDSLQKALKLITCKGPAIGRHKQTELEKSFEEARIFFGKLEFSKGLEIVEHLEQRCRRLQQ